jgi:hypothetical protein
MGALYPAGDRDLLPRLQARDGLKASAIFVTKRKSIKEILNGREADALQVCSALRSHAPEVLKWSL